MVYEIAVGGEGGLRSFRQLLTVLLIFGLLLVFGFSPVALGPAPAHSMRPGGELTIPGTGQSALVSADGSLDKAGNLWVAWAEPVGVYARYYDGKTWSPRIQVDDDTQFSVYGTALRGVNALVDGSSDMWVIWDNSSLIGARSYNGVAWSEEYRLAEGFHSYASTTTAVDPWGHVWVGWRASHDIWARYFNGTSWSEPYRFNHIGASIDNLILLRGGTNTLWAFWYEHRKEDTTRTLLTKFFNGSAWSEEVSIVGDLGFVKERVLCDAVGNVWVFWVGSASRLGGPDRALHTRCYNGTTWSNPVQLSNQITHGSLSVAGDAEGGIWVFWNAQESTNVPYETQLTTPTTPPDILVYARYWDGASWSEPRPVAKTDLGQFDCAIDKANRPWLFWSYFGILNATSYEEPLGSWTAPEVVAASKTLNGTFTTPTSGGRFLKIQADLSFRLTFDTFDNLWVFWTSEQEYHEVVGTTVGNAKLVHLINRVDAMAQYFNGTLWVAPFALYHYEEETVLIIPEFPLKTGVTTGTVGLLAIILGLGRKRTRKNRG